jgi:Carboxypeptidase regulatory-like domain
MTKHKYLFLLLLLGTLGITWVGTPGYGQVTILSNIVGHVTDASGGAVPGATIIVLNQETGFTRSVKSGSAGDYFVNDIVAGRYTLTVEAPGFEKYVRTDLNLVSAREMRINATLQVGKMSQSVTVTGRTPLIQTESATISTLASNAYMNQVDTVGSIQGGRIPYAFFYMVPGNAMGNNTGSMGIGDVSFDGLPRDAGASTITLDGVRVAAKCCQIVPTLETIDEMEVVTNGSAEYPTPSTVVLVTRSGGNHIHGDAWELYDDKSLEARDPTLPEPAIFHANTFGGSLGGPIKKNRLFYFLGYEGLRSSNIAVSVTPVTANNVPTAQMMQGDFSQLLDPAFVGKYNDGKFVTVNDPYTGQPFPNNVIPSSLISPVAQNFIKNFWTNPTGPGLTANQYTNALRPFRRDKLDTKVDYNLSSQNTMYARFGYTYLNVSLPTAPFTVADAGNRFEHFPGRSGSLSDTYSFSPAVVNQVNVGFTRTLLAFGEPYDNDDVLSNLGMQGAQGIEGLPGLSFINFTGLPALSFSELTNQVLGVTDDLSVFKGVHDMKLGFLFDRAQEFNTAENTPPSFRFTGGVSGYDWADFMLGVPDSATKSLAPSSYYLFQNEWGTYFEDSIKVRRDLTLGVGLRWDILPFASEKYGELATFDIGKQAVVVPNSNSFRFVIPTFPSSATPILTAAQANYPANNSSLNNTDYHDLAPRISIAWRPFGTDNWVVRSGYGIYDYQTVYGVGGSPNGSVFTGSQTVIPPVTPQGTLAPTISLLNPFPAFGPPTAVNPDNLSFSAFDPNLAPPRVQEYTLSVEHELKGWGLRGSYLGSMVTGLQYSSPYNEPAPSNVPFAQSRRPVPLVQNITLVQNGGFDRNDEFQFEVRHPTKYGLFFDGSFTWMKNLTDVDTVGPNIGSYYNLRRFLSNADDEPPKELILSYSYALPVGHGKHYLSSSPRIVDGILGGWSLTGVTEFQSGYYITPYYVGVDPAGMEPGSNEELPDRVGNPNLSGSQRDYNGLHDLPFFNTAAFVCPGGSTINGQANSLSAGCPLSTPQNVGRLGNSSPDTLLGPGINTWNWSIAKQFALPREGANLQIAAQIANPWNHTSWAPPSVDLSSPSTLGRYTATANEYIQPFSYGFRKITLNMRINF